MSGGKGSGHEELYGGGGQRIELRGRRSEVRGQKEDDRRRKAEDRRSSCGSGFLAAILRFQSSSSGSGQVNYLIFIEKMCKYRLISGVHSNNKCNGILVIVIFEKHLIGRCKTQCFSWAVV